MNFIESHYFYLRGVSNSEAKKALEGINGRVQDSQGITNREANSQRLCFGLNVNNKGIDFNILNDILLELIFYSSIGAHVESGINPREDPLGFRNTISGKILVYASTQPFDIDKSRKNMYGDNWKTTTILPDDCDSKFLLGVIDSNPYYDLKSYPSSKVITFTPSKMYENTIGVISFNNIFLFEEFFKKFVIEILSKIEVNRS